MWRNRPRSARTRRADGRLFAAGDAAGHASSGSTLDVARRQPVPRLAGTGRYHTYLCDEVVPWVDERYRTLSDAANRGIAGKSSGGYGAMVTPMLRPDLFRGFATHAGDALFETCYLPDFR
jgi:S-formylglutathione hydrolase FrmB